MEQVISYLDSAEEAVADAGYQLLRFVKGCQNRDVECDNEVKSTITYWFMIRTSL